MSLWFLSSVAWATGEKHAGSWSHSLERSHFPSALLTWVFDQGFLLGMSDYLASSGYLCFPFDENQLAAFLCVCNGVLFYGAPII